MPYVLMYPGRFDEQPIPLMVKTSCGWSPSSATAVLRALSTPKSPQPGHQSGSALPLKSLTDSGARFGFASTAVLASLTAGSAIGSSVGGDTMKVSPKGYTLISCTGTYFLVLPASTSRTPSTRWWGRNGSPSYLRMWASATTPVSERRYRA